MESDMLASALNSVNVRMEEIESLMWKIYYMKNFFLDMVHEKGA